MTTEHIPWRRTSWSMILIMTIGAIWTTILAVHHGGAMMWPVVAWLWVSVIMALGRRHLPRRH